MTDQWTAAKLDREYEERRRAALATSCYCGGCLRNGWDFCPRSAAEEDAMQQKKRADDLYERRLPCREAEVAQKRYEEAEANAEFYERRADALQESVTDLLATLAVVEAERDKLRAEKRLRGEGECASCSPITPAACVECKKEQEDDHAV